nr:MAG TPA: hypothetical protein [Caudoviricetes sp.]
MTDNITKGFTDKECEILIKDIVTLVMMGYVIDDESNDINNAKAKTYQTVANVINDIEHGINDMSDLALVALTTSMLSSKIYKRKVEVKENDNKQSRE